MVTITTVSTSQLTLNNRLKIAGLTAEVAKAGKEVATGFKSDVFASLGTGAAQSLVLRQQMELADSFLTTNTLIDGRMSAMEEALGSARDSAQTVFNLAVQNAGTPTDTAAQLKQSAIDALNSIVASMNSNYAGSALFAGTATDGTALKGWSSTAGGNSPANAFAALIGGSPTDAADAASKLAALEAAFASDGTTSADFEGTFYTGTPAATAGTANARLTARVADGVTLDYGVQANDPALRDTLRGLVMLATTDVSQITDDAAYSAWIGAATEAIGSGISGLDEARSTVGAQRAQLETQSDRHQVLSDLYNNRIVDLEGADPEEAAVRLSALRAQLELSYSVTSQMMQMSILNYI